MKPSHPWLRLRAFWRVITPLDRIALVVLAISLASYALQFVGWRVPLAGYLQFIGILSGGYLAIRWLRYARTHMLWSLRNRLVVAYLFIAVVPVLLLLTMAGLAAYLDYIQLGAHLLSDAVQHRAEHQRTTAQTVADALAADPAALAAVAAQPGGPLPPEALARPGIAAALVVARSETPNLRAELSEGSDLLKKEFSGDGKSFSGLVQSQGALWLESIVVVPTPGHEQVLRLIAPVNGELLERLAPELGPIQLMLFNPVPENAAGGSPPGPAGLHLSLDGQAFVSAERISSRKRTLAPPASRWDPQIGGVSTLDSVWVGSRGQQPLRAPVVAFFSLRPSILNHILFTSLGELGGALVFGLELVGVAFLLLEIAALITGVVLTRRITHAVSDLYDATEHVRKGDFTHRVRVGQRDQLGVLGESFNSMTSAVAELIEEQRQRQRLENELSIAHEVQAQLFPRELPVLPGIELGAVCRAARSVSGDYYDFIRLGPARLAVALADISGKGISAALLMASLQAAMRSQAQLDGQVSTADLVSRLNRHLYLNTSDDRYATLFYAVYDSASRTLCFTNAGHLAPFYISGNDVKRLEEGGVVVGLMDECAFTQGMIQVAPGSLLVAYSDGITEPENVYGEEFGGKRLLEEVLRHRDLRPQRLAEQLIAAAEQWSETPEQADDMTVIVARMG